MDSFMHTHQSAIDRQREDDAIQYLQDTGVYPDPDDKYYPTKLEQIRDSLDKYIKEELEKSPPDRDWEVFSFEDDLYEIIESFDQIIYYDPTP